GRRRRRGLARAVLRARAGDEFRLVAGAVAAGVRLRARSTVLRADETILASTALAIAAEPRLLRALDAGAAHRKGVGPARPLATDASEHEVPAPQLGPRPRGVADRGGAAHAAGGAPASPAAQPGVHRVVTRQPVVVPDRP